MKLAATIARYVMGLMFTVFGLNGFLHFLPAPPPTDPLALQFVTALGASHYMVPVFLLQLISGILFLSGYYVPMALTLIGPVLVNILLFHATMDPGGIGPGVLVTVLWFLVFMSYRANFAGLFKAKGV